MIPSRRRKVIRILLGLGGIAVLALVVLVLSFDWLVTRTMAVALGGVTGGRVELGRVELGFRQGTFHLERLRLFNPPEFGGGILLDLPELFLAYAPAAAATNGLHFKEVRLNLAELGLVVDARGRTNIVALGRSLAQLSPSSTNGFSRANFTGIDLLTVSLGQVSLIDQRPPIRTNLIRLGLHQEVLRNIRTEADLAPLVFKLLLGGAFR